MCKAEAPSCANGSTHRLAHKVLGIATLSIAVLCVQLPQVGLVGQYDVSLVLCWCM